MEEEATLTPAQIAEMRAQIRELKRTGRPEVAAKIALALENGQMATLELMAGDDEVVTETGEIEAIPPRRGKGASRAMWVAFAREITDWDDEVIDNLGRRDDIIRTLEANGYIPQEIK